MLIDIPIEIAKKDFYCPPRLDLVNHVRDSGFPRSMVSG